MCVLRSGRLKIREEAFRGPFPFNLNYRRAMYEIVVSVDRDQMTCGSEVTCGR